MRTTARSLEALVPISCPCSALPLERTTVILCSPLTTWLLVTMSPCASIITPEPICSPCAVVTSSSTTVGSILAMAASCWAWSEVPLDVVAVEVAPAFVVVLALLLAYAYSHPENRPVPKMRARTSVRSRIAPAGPRRRRFRGGMGGGGSVRGGEPNGSTMACSVGASVAGGAPRTPADAGATGWEGRGYGPLSFFSFSFVGIYLFFVLFRFTP